MFRRNLASQTQNNIKSQGPKAQTQCLYLKNLKIEKRFEQTAHFGSADIDNIQFRAKYQLENISEPYVCSYTRIATQKTKKMLNGLRTDRFK